MKKIIFLVLLAVSLSACLKDNKINLKIENEILNNNNEKILILGLESKTYKIGDILNLELRTEVNTKIIAFDLVLDKEKLGLKSIEKFEFTENENLVSSEEIENGYRIIFADLKNDLKKDEIFAKISLNVKWTGSEEIKIENLLEEN